MSEVATIIGIVIGCVGLPIGLTFYTRWKRKRHIKKVERILTEARNGRTGI